MRDSSHVKTPACIIHQYFGSITNFQSVVLKIAFKLQKMHQLFPAQAQVYFMIVQSKLQ